MGSGGTTRLLFGGDAQIENWEYALKFAPDKADNLDRLRLVDLYKVGHHGSHNGTPVEVAHEVLGGVTSLLSVRPIERWAHIPKDELVASLVTPPRTVVSSVFAAADPCIAGVRCHPAGLWKGL